jgi:crotonobetainyl-CoA:carnitine CoA-transferase CaiB-like acyl-CoA transferase
MAAGLFARDRTGEAQQIDVSLYAVGMWLMSQNIGAAPLGLEPSPARANRHNPWNPLVNMYQTQDARWLQLCMLQPDPYWPDFCEHISRPDLIADPRFANIDARQENSAELVTILDGEFARFTLDEWRVKFATLKGVWAPALSPKEVSEDPQVAANDYFPEVTAADGSKFRSVAAPVQFGGRGVGGLRAMPQHGENTEEVLLEYGYTWDDIIALKDLGAIL